MMLSKWDVALINVKEDKCGKTNMSEIKPEPAAHNSRSQASTFG